MKRIAVAASFAASLVVAHAAAPFSPARIAMNKPTAPFHIIGPIYYVGTADLSVHLIATRAGLILIDEGMPESVPQIEANIEKLGFRLKDVKLLLAGHAHYDHVGGLAALKKATGAQVVVSAGDEPFLEIGHITFGPSKLVKFTPVQADRIVHDGETVSLGGFTLTAHLTPGHTQGDTSWTMPFTEGGIAHTVLFVGSTAVAGNPLVGNKEYPNIVADYRSAFANLKTIKADVLLTEHQDVAGEIAKAARSKPGTPNPFVDAGELAHYLDNSERDFEQEYAKQLGKH